MDSARKLPSVVFKLVCVRINVFSGKTGIYFMLLHQIMGIQKWLRLQWDRNLSLSVFSGEIGISGALGDEEIAGGNRDLVGKVLSSHNF